MDDDVVRSVKSWFKKNEEEGGKTMFNEDVHSAGFAYGWCTSFQLKVMAENKTIYCMDSTHKTIKDIVPIEEGTKVHKSGYLFTLLVKDKDIKRGIPVAFLVCKSESQ
ncbi:hypothetical protein BGX21_007373 [Mortierella sp. AD011]|nr:hypothetical protein BGX21_007373 [Mortierella sp. AD011]